MEKYEVEVIARAIGELTAATGRAIADLALTLTEHAGVDKDFLLDDFAARLPTDPETPHFALFQGIRAYLGRAE